MTIQKGKDYSVIVDDWSDYKKQWSERQKEIASQQKQGVSESDVDKKISEAVSAYEKKDKQQTEIEHKQIQKQIEDIVVGDINLTGYAKKSDIPEQIDAYSKTETDSKYQPKGQYLTEHQNLDDYAKKEDIPVVPEQVDAYSKSEADEKFQVKGVYLTEHQDLSEYAKKSDIPSTEGFLTEHQSLDDYVKKADIPEIPEQVDAYTKDESDAKYQIKGNYLTEHQDLSEYAKKSDIPSIDRFLTEHQDLSDYAKKEDIPEIPKQIDAYTKEESDTKYQLKGDYLTEHQDLSEYAKKSDIPEISESFDSVSKEEYDELLQKFNKLETYVNTYLALTVEQLEQKNDELIDNLSATNKTVDIPEPMSSVVIPETSTIYTVNVPLKDNSTVELTSNKSVYVNNTSKETVNTTISRTVPEDETSTTATSVYLSGSFDTVNIENVTITTSTKAEPAIIKNVVIGENNKKNVSVTAVFVDGATITNNSDNDVTITNKSEEISNMTIVAPNSTVTLSAGTFDTIESTVGENTLVIKKSVHIKNLKVTKGNVIVMNKSVDMNIDNIINDTEYTVEPQTIEVSEGSKFSAAMSKDGIINVTEDLTGCKAVVSPVSPAYYNVLNLNGHTISGGTSNGFLHYRYLSSTDIYNGTIINEAGYGIWAGGTGVINLHNVNIKADTHAIYAEVSGAQINVYGGRLEVFGEDKRYVVNYLDKIWTSGYRAIHLYEGTECVDFDPANSIGEPGGPVSILDEGYTTTSYTETIDGVEHTIYKVIKAE